MSCRLKAYKTVIVNRETQNEIDQAIIICLGPLCQYYTLQIRLSIYIYTYTCAAITLPYLRIAILQPAPGFNAYFYTYFYGFIIQGETLNLNISRYYILFQY